MSDKDHWFLEAMQIALPAASADRVKAALYENCATCGELKRRDEDCGCVDEFVCLVCRRDCRDALGLAAPECRADIRAD